MARSIGLIQLEGDLGEYVFYRLNGKSVVRKKDVARKQRVKTDVAFARTMENSVEFSGSTQISKLLREKSSVVTARFRDNALHLRLNATIRHIMNLADGIRGQRPFLVEHCGLLIGMEWNEKKPLKSFWTGKIMPVDKGAAVGIGFEGNAEDLKPYVGATHVRMVGALVCLTDVVYNLDSKRYLPISEVFGKTTMAESSLIELGSAINIELEVEKPESGAYLMLAGLEYVQVVGDKVYKLEGRALRVV